MDTNQNGQQQNPDENINELQQQQLQQRNSIKLRQQQQDELSTLPQTQINLVNDNKGGNETSDVVLNVIRVIILISCIFLAIITIPTLITLLFTEPISTFCLTEFIYLFTQVAIGFYGTYKRRRPALIIFFLLSLLNTIILFTKLSIDTKNYGFGHVSLSSKFNDEQSSSFIEPNLRIIFNDDDEKDDLHIKNNSFIINNFNKKKFFNYLMKKKCSNIAGCDENNYSINCIKTCCQNLDLNCKFSKILILENDDDNNNNNRRKLENSELGNIATPPIIENPPNEIGDYPYEDWYDSAENKILYLYLWFIAIYCLLLTILSGILFILFNNKSIPTQQQQQKSIIPPSPSPSPTTAITKQRRKQAKTLKQKQFPNNNNRQLASSQVVDNNNNIEQQLDQQQKQANLLPEQQQQTQIGGVNRIRVQSEIPNKQFQVNYNNNLAANNTTSIAGMKNFKKLELTPSASSQFQLPQQQSPKVPRRGSSIRLPKN